MIRSRLLPCLLAALIVTAGAAQARQSDVTSPDLPRSLPTDGKVSVQWDDPARFSEILHSGNRWEARRGTWVEDLARYVRTSAEKRLPAGSALAVTIHDVTRAGNYEPWHGGSTDTIRYVRDIYPPRMTLSYRLTDASGRVVAEGEQKKISDLAFTMNASRVNDTDPLRYEKRMVDDWVRKDITTPGV